MNETRKEFSKYLEEVNKYFEIISVLDEGSCKLVIINILGQEKIKSIDDSLIKILKANCFLLLYNLIEATIRNSIQAIIRSIHTEKMTFKNISENLRSIWINQELKNLNENSIRKNITDIAKKILNDELLNFEDTCIKISGNLDAQKIREIAKSFGYKESKNGSGLLTIKKKRNDLAHGAVTFSDIGKEYSSKDLIKYKEETAKYLNDVLCKIDEYINKKLFYLSSIR